MTILNMKKRIMIGVYLMYSLRKLSASWRKPFIAESSFFIILAIILSVFVSVPSVLSNMLESGSFYRYFLMAFSHTSSIVQMTLILSGLTAIFFVRNITFQAILKTRPA